MQLQINSPSYYTHHSSSHSNSIGTGSALSSSSSHHDNDSSSSSSPYYPPAPDETLQLLGKAGSDTDSLRIVDVDVDYADAHDPVHFLSENDLNFFDAQVLGKAVIDLDSLEALDINIDPDSNTHDHELHSLSDSDFNEAFGLPQSKASTSDLFLNGIRSNEDQTLVLNDIGLPEEDPPLSPISSFRSDQSSFSESDASTSGSSLPLITSTPFTIQSPSCAGSSSSLTSAAPLSRSSISSPIATFHQYNVVNFDVDLKYNNNINVDSAGVMSEECVHAFASSSTLSSSSSLSAYPTNSVSLYSHTNSLLYSIRQTHQQSSRSIILTDEFEVGVAAQSRSGTNYFPSAMGSQFSFRHTNQPINDNSPTPRSGGAGLINGPSSSVLIERDGFLNSGTAHPEEALLLPPSSSFPSDQSSFSRSDGSGNSFSLTTTNSPPATNQSQIEPDQFSLPVYRSRRRTHLYRRRTHPRPTSYFRMPEVARKELEATQTALIRFGMFTPPMEERRELAQKLGIPIEKVTKWFENHRITASGIISRREKCENPLEVTPSSTMLLGEPL